MKSRTILHNDQFFKLLISGNFQNLHSAKNTRYPIPYTMRRTLLLFIDYPGIDPDTEHLEKNIDLMLLEYPILVELNLLKTGIAASRNQFRRSSSHFIGVSPIGK